MYEAYYGFNEKPFNLTPDPKYLYLSARHTEAFAHLEFGRRERGGFVVVTGEVGTGKTTLARYFLGRLGEQTATAFVLYPALTASELLEAILEDLKVPGGLRKGSLKDLVDQLHRFLLRAHEEGRDVVLLIDEAQDLSPEVLEQVRLLSNLETDTEKLITIVLMGQSELQEMLSRRELRQLAQRVTARYHLSPLGRGETEEYVRHRLQVAGGTGKVTFTRGALSAIHGLSGGVPRLINLLCDRALLAGYVRGSRLVGAGMVVSAEREVRAGRAPRFSARRYAAVGGGALLLAVAAALWFPGASAPPARATATPRPPAAPAAASPPPATVAPAPVLEPVLLTLPHEASLEGSLREVQALWGEAPLERTTLRTHMEQVGRLDLPVVLEMFHPARRDTCYLALLRVEGDEAVVASGAGAPLRVPLSELDRLWTRQAVFLWKDFDSLVRAAHPSRTAAWARAALSRLGYPGDEADLAEAVARFQRDADLVPDGLIGSRTLMILYSLGDYPRPRLRHAPVAEHASPGASSAAAGARGGDS